MKRARNEASEMNSMVGNPEIGQWYERVDTGERFQVTGLDEGARTIEIQGLDGNIDEIDADTWAALPLELTEQPEESVESADELEAQDLACLQAEKMLENPAALERLA